MIFSIISICAEKKGNIMSWNTKITKLLNIDYPIIQGAMAYISDGVLAAAMSHAGCAGVIGSGGFTPDEVQSHIRRFKDIAGSQKSTVST